MASSFIPWRAGAVALAIQLLAGAATAAAEGDPTAQFKMLARVATESGWCRRLAYTINKPRQDQLLALVLANAVRSGQDKKTADALSARIIERENDDEDLWHDAASNRADANNLRPYAVEVYEHHRLRCDALAEDPLGGTVIGKPSAAAAVVARRQMVDEKVELAGQASWQTPAILARGLRLQAAGMCAAQLSDAEKTRLTGGLAAATKSADPATARTARYYSNAYEAGRSEAKDAVLTKAQCDRVMAKQDAAVAAAP
jgi:hypothetical protein